MNVNEFINNHGMTVVPNPNYNPRSKKNKEPRLLTVPDLTAKHDDVLSLALRGANESYSISEKEANKYAEYGLTYSPKRNMDKLLIDAQSGWEKIGHGLAQAIVSEVGIGTIKGFSDLIDMVGQITGISDADYSNPVTQYLEEKQQEFEDWVPIYADSSLDISNGGLIDAGWWAKNLPSVMSSLTLLLPSTAVTKGVSMAGKAFKLGSYTRKGVRVLTGAEKALNEFRAADKIVDAANGAKQFAKLNKFQRFMNSSSTAAATSMFLENGLTATLSRAMENYQEARQSYNDMLPKAINKLEEMSPEEYDKFLKDNEELLQNFEIDGSDKSEVAKAIAKSAADRTFQMDWINVGFDILQMYSLRNMWKGIKNNNDNPMTLRRTRKDAAKYFGKTPEEIAILKSERKFREKAGEWLYDKLGGSFLVVGAELSEGVEEAVNYIAQQEGMHLGNVLLGEEEGSKEQGLLASVKTIFDPRIKQYINAPELWDSAFWGVMGGVIFQGLGSKFAQIKANLEREKSDATENNKRKWSEIFELNELPEVERRKSALEKCNIDFNQFKEHMDKINDGIDIYHSTAEHEVKFENDIDKEAAKDKLIEEFVSKMTFRNMNAGNLNMLKAYLADENLRKGMVQNGFFNETKNGQPVDKSETELDNESKKFINKLLDIVEKVERRYDEELLAVDGASAIINSRSKNAKDIPAEYLQIIATNNVKARIELDYVDKLIADTQDRIAPLKKLYNDNHNLTTEDYTEVNDHEQNVYIGVVTSQLADLYAQRKALRKEGESLSNEIAISNINKRVDFLESQLKEHELAYAVTQGLIHTLDKNGKLIPSTEIEDINLAKAYDEEVLSVSKLVNEKDGTQVTEDVKKVMKLAGMEDFSERARTSLTVEEKGKYDKLASDANATFEKLLNEEPVLNKEFQRLAALKLKKAFVATDLARTVNEVEAEVNVLHNTMDAARVDAINNSNKTIQNAYKTLIKAGLNDKFKTIIGRYVSTGNLELTDDIVKELNKQNINSASIEDALKVLDLTKSHNKGLANTLNDIFELQEAFTAQQEIAEQGSNNGEEGESSTENNQPNSGTQSSTLGNPSTNTSNARSGNERQQKAPKDQQNIANRKPTYYVEFNARNESKNQSKSKGKYKTPVYDNNDGTYTLGATETSMAGDIPILKNPDFFVGGDEVDLTRPYEVVKYPVARRNSKGRLVITEQGIIKNTDTIEAQQETLTEEEEINEGQPVDDNEGQPVDNTAEVLPDETPEDTNDGEETPTEEEPQQSSGSPAPTSSTGVSKQTTPTSAPKDNYQNTGDILDDYVSIDQKVFTEALQRFIVSYKADNNIDFDELANKIIDEYVSQNAPRDVVETKVNKAKTIIKTRAEKANVTKMQSSIFELICESSLVEFTTKMSFGDDYKTAVRDMMDAYCKEVGISTINGKIYVNLEDLLRYVNRITNDSDTATLLYGTLSSYLNTQEGQNKYVLTDESEVNKVEFLNNVNKSQEVRDEERQDRGNYHRVDIYSFVDELSKQEREEFFTALSELKLNDDVSVEHSKYEIILKDKKGRRVGRLPLPIRSTQHGGFEMFNKGFRTDVNIVNGEIISDGRELLRRWFVNETNDASIIELNNILYEWAYGKPTENRRKELINQLNNNPEFIEASNNGFISSKKGLDVVLDGFANIIKYVKPKGSITSIYAENLSDEAKLNAEENMYWIDANLDKWFEHLYNEYVFVTSLHNSAINTVKVADITDGEIIRAQEQVTDPTKLPVASKAIVGGVKPDIHKICVGDPKIPSLLHISDNVDVSTTLAGKGGVTFVMLPNRSGRPDYVQAFPQTLDSKQLGKDAKEMFEAIKSEFGRLFDEYVESQNADTSRALIEFLDDLLYSRKNTNFIYNTHVTHPGERGICIINKIDKNQRFIEFFRLNNYGGYGTIFKLTDELGNKIQINIAKKNDADIKLIKSRFNEFISNSIFNISPDYVNSDGHSDVNLGGIATKKNGKFVVNIGNKTWSYNSFNEFVLNNDLVQLNTKPNAKGTSNYNPKGVRSQAANQTFSISLNTTNNSQTPVEGEKKTTSKKVVSKSINDQVKDILGDINVPHKGLAIARLFYTEEQIKAIENLGILPKNIIFDEKFNEKENYADVNAEVDKTTGYVTVGTKWMNMFSNPNTRAQAIRKLIHEQIHLVLAKKPGYVENIKDIYNEFKKALNNPITGEEYNKWLTEFGLTDEEARQHLKAYLFEDAYANENTRLEEFLVETLTSKELAMVMNNIESEDVKKKSNLNLLQRIFKVLTELFGWDVKRGSLYWKELNTLREATSKTDSKVVSKKEVNGKAKAEAIVDQITKDGERLELTDDEVFYIDKDGKTLYGRVTTAIQADEENMDADGTVHKFDKDNPWVVPSTNIGTGVDEFTRDFFSGQLNDKDSDYLENNYPNVTGNDWMSYKEQLEKFKSDLENGKVVKGKNITIVSRDIHASGEIEVNMPDGSIKKMNITGTLDLLGYDENGEFYIFDMKTIHSDNISIEKSNKWNRQLQLYKQFLESKYGIKVNDCYIIPIKVEYDNPLGSKNGTTSYEVRNPELKHDYDNPMRTQLMADDTEFRGAAPSLQLIRKQNPQPGKILYNNLEYTYQQVIDGKLDANSYLDKNEKAPVLPKDEASNVKKETDKYEDVSDVLSDDDNLFNLSSVTELYHENDKVTIANNVSSLRGFIEQLPLATQVKFARAIETGDVSTSCR